MDQTEGEHEYIRIRFIRAWGHPGRNEIYGPGQAVIVSRWWAINLVNGGYAVYAR